MSLRYRSRVRRVAAPIVALLGLAPTAHAAVLSVQPKAWSPRVGPLAIHGQLTVPGQAGVRIATRGGRSLGWVVRPARRRRVEGSWGGRLLGRTLPEGHYRAQLVVGGRVLASSPFRIDVTPPRLRPLSVGNGGAPFAGDRRLLTTISPNSDGLRDRAIVRFTLDEPATVTMSVETTVRRPHVVSSETLHFGTGPHSLVWAPQSTTPPRTYLLHLDVTDAAGNTRAYGAETAYVDRYASAPVVRVLGIDAAFSQPSYAPGQLAALTVATDAPAFTLQIFRVGGELVPTYLSNEMSGLPVTQPELVPWLLHASAPDTISLRIGAWRTGLYYAEMRSADGRVGYAPFVLRPGVLGSVSRVAVVLPTNTWQAYNFYDDNGDGYGDTWYAGGGQETAGLGRPFLNRGVPPFFAHYDEGFQTWLARTKANVEFLSESDLSLVRTGRDLARLYDLVVFPGHTEYVTDHEYDLVEQYRDAGGNLAFLSADNFFWRIQLRGRVMIRTERWRDLGRPEAAVIGVQYRANDEGGDQGDFVVRSAQTAPWLWQGTGLGNGDTFGEFVGGYGIEIDSMTSASPPGTIVLAEIPDIFGPGLTAQMTYYETAAGAKVFAAGALDFGGSSDTWPVTHMLQNLWSRLSSP
jgi:hypothetical protein